MSIHFKPLYVYDFYFFGFSVFKLNARIVNLKPIKDIPKNYKHISAEKIKDYYIAGYSVLKIASLLNVSRTLITKRLKDMNYKIRNGSEANIIRFKNSTIDYRQQITKAAHDKVRGSTCSIQKKIARAVSREKTANKAFETYGYIGIGEIVLYKAFVKNNIPAIPQKAFYIYNIDFFINPNIFIEVSCSSNPKKSQSITKHTRNKGKFLDKVKEIAKNNGILIEINTTSERNIIGSLNDIIAFIQRISANPPATCKHFVVACYTKGLPHSSRDSKNGRFIKTSSTFKELKRDICEIYPLPSW